MIPVSTRATDEDWLRATKLTERHRKRRIDFIVLEKRAVHRF
jgi:hypothetical protein